MLEVLNDSIREFPELVNYYSAFLREVSLAEAFLEFQRYVSGLIVSKNKTVLDRESRNQGFLNRLLTESPFSLEELNCSHLSLLASLPGTQIKSKWVLSIEHAADSLRSGL